MPILHLVAAFADSPGSTPPFPKSSGGTRGFTEGQEMTHQDRPWEDPTLPREKRYQLLADYLLSISKDIPAFCAVIHDLTGSERITPEALLDVIFAMSVNRNLQILIEGISRNMLATFLGVMGEDYQP